MAKKLPTITKNEGGHMTSHISYLDKASQLALQLQEELPNHPLIPKLVDALDELQDSMRATKPLRGMYQGYHTLDEAKKNMACDQLIAIARELKKAKGL